MSERSSINEAPRNERQKEGFIARHRKAFVAVVALTVGGGFFAQHDTEQVTDGQRIETTQSQNEVSPNAMSAADEFLKEHKDVINAVYTASESEEDSAQAQYDLAISTLAEKYGVSDTEVHDAVFTKILKQSTPETSPDDHSQRSPMPIEG